MRALDWLLSLLVMICCCVQASGSELQPLPVPNPTAEAWVEHMVITGDTPHVDEKFESESDRVVSVKLLTNLLHRPQADDVIPRKRIWIVGAIFSEPVDLENADVGYEIRLERCRFLRKVDLRSSTFRMSVAFDGSLFDEAADFAGMKVNGSLYFRNSVFAHSADFRSAIVSGDFDASEARFEAIHFENAGVRGDAYFRQAEFTESADFRDARINGSLLAENTRFAGAEFHFERVRVHGVGQFYRAQFSGLTEFTRAEFGDLAMKESRFINRASDVSFDAMRVKRSAHLESSVFDGRVHFSGSRIGSHLQLDNAHFNFPDHSVDFLGTEVGEAYFQHTQFAGPIHLQYGRFRYLEFLGSNEERPWYRKLDLSGSAIEGNLVLENLWIDDLLARRLRVDGDAHIERVAILENADLQQSNFGALELIQVAWPTTADAVQLNEMGYKQISAGDQKNSWRALLDLVDHSAWNASAYTNLEAFLSRDGYTNRADEVFIAFKKRERGELFQEPNWVLNLPEGFANWALGWLVGHGRHPVYAFGWSVVVIAIGCFVFTRERMQPVNSHREAGTYRAIFYSIEQFLPVSFGEAARWRPRDDSVARGYAKLHRFLGWFLIPLGLAAITGVLGKS